MKKLISLIAVALLIGSVAHAADTMFFGSGALGASVVIGKGGGAISAQDVLISVETNATAVVWRGNVSSTLTNTASYTGTSFVMNTDSTNTVDGVTITDSDYLVVGSTFLDITDVTVVAGGLATTITVASTTVAPKQPIHVCDADDNISLYARTTWGGAPIPFLFKGFNNSPAVIVVPSAAGATMVSGRAVRD